MGSQYPNLKSQKAFFPNRWKAFCVMENIKNIITAEEYQRRHGKPVGEEEKRKEKGFYVRIPKKWWFEALKGLRPIERCLLIDLRLYASPTGFCWPSLRRLSSDLGIAINSTRKYLKSLEKKGHLKITITKKGYWNKWTYLLYHI